LGDTADLTFSVEAGADPETLALARTWPWDKGERSVAVRAAAGGLIAAVVESWTPAGDHSYGVLLEDDIEVSPFFYAYLKLTLLRYAYGRPTDPSTGDGGARPPTAAEAPPVPLLSISLYTPRLVELTMPRRRIDVYQELGTHQVPTATARPPLCYLFWNAR
jgi:hypothetical protein